MKTFYYYLSLTALWLIFVFLIASLFVVLGFSRLSEDYGFYAKLGSECTNLQILLFSLGTVLLLRPIIYLKVFNSHKKFAKDTAIACIVLSILWLIFSLSFEAITKNESKEIMEQYKSGK